METFTRCVIKGYFDISPLLLICYTLFTAYFGGYLLAGALGIFAVLRATHGAAFGMVTVSVNTVAIDIMPATRRGEGIGYFGVSTNLAMAFGPMLALMLYDATGNYDWIFGVAMGVGVLGLCSAAMVRGANPQAVGAKQTVSLDRFLLIKGVPGAVTTVFLSFAYGVLSTYVAVYGADEVGIESGSGRFFVFLAAGLVVSRLISGRLINRGYLTRVSKAGTLVIIAGFLTFALLKHPMAFYGCGVAIGVGSGLLCPALPVINEYKIQVTLITVINHFE